jgi:hypothetical protein
MLISTLEVGSWKKCVCPSCPFECHWLDQGKRRLTVARQSPFSAVQQRIRRYRVAGDE